MGRRLSLGDRNPIAFWLRQGQCRTEVPEKAADNQLKKMSSDSSAPPARIVTTQLDGFVALYISITIEVSRLCALVCVCVCIC